MTVDKIKRVITCKMFLFTVWAVVTLVCCLLKYGRDPYIVLNNFTIFCNSFIHAIEGLPLYEAYPSVYHDFYLYGIAFTPVIAPFTLFPKFLGNILWCVSNSALLFFALKALKLKPMQFAFIILVCANELYTCSLQQQFNPSVCATVVLSYVFIERKREFWAACMIMFGSMTKIYGVVGLAFFFFAKRPFLLIAGLLFWGAVFFFFPMVYTSPEYVMGQYSAWFDTLVTKNHLNMFSDYTNISLLGIIRKVSGSSSYSDLWILFPGMFLFAAPYFRVKQYKSVTFRLSFLCSTLLFMVLFSTGTESYGYITAMVAVCIWYVTTPSRNLTPGLNMFLLIFCIILTSLSPTDIFPCYIRKTYVIPYALKALPCVFIWLKIIWEQLTLDYTAEEL